MTKQEFKTGIQKAVHMHELPPEKWPQVVRRTLIGAVFVALGVVGMARFGFPWYAGLGCVVVGSTVWSTQLITGVLRALLDPFTAYKRAIRGD